MKADISHLTLPDNFDEYTDFFIPDDSPLDGLAFPDAKKIKLNSELIDIITFMIDAAKKESEIEFSLNLLKNNKKIIFRGHSIISREGKVFIFRRLPSIVPNIDSLGINDKILEIITSKNLNAGGLIIIAGETGQGKSTLAGSMIIKRLKTHGSFCLTIENPVELPLEGVYAVDGSNKKGVCYQTEIKSDEFPNAIKSSLRCYPAVSSSILFLGETRDSETAYEVLKIAANGHLVITTMHASGVIEAIKRFASLAVSGSNVGEAEIKSILGTVFKLAIHQKLEFESKYRKKLKQVVLFSNNSVSPIAAKIRDGLIDQLSTEIQSQNSQINKGISLLDDE